ncbi:hypothetical protein Lal_00026189, partial [Lupinus albus]
LTGRTFPRLSAEKSITGGSDGGAEEDIGLGDNAMVTDPSDNMRYREALTNASCPNCGGLTAIGEMSFDEHQLRLENARLREEVQDFAKNFFKLVVVVKTDFKKWAH